jgi:hypothetical protein
MESDIAVKVGVSLSLILLGRLSGLIWSWVRYLPAKRFWRPVAKPGLTVVVGRHELHKFEASGLIGVGDAKAVDVLRAYFRKVHLPSGFSTAYVDEIPSGGGYEGTFLCLGGPNASPGGKGLIADLWQQAPTSFEWGDPSERDITIYDRLSGKEIFPSGFPGPVTRDHALIVRMLNPFSQSGAKDYALLFAGCLGFGTWGATRFATTPEFLKDQRVARTEEFECLVSIDVANRSPVQMKLEAFRQLRRENFDSL